MHMHLPELYLTLNENEVSILLEWMAQASLVPCPSLRSAADMEKLSKRIQEMVEQRMPALGVPDIQPFRIAPPPKRGKR
jgi:hypothetical protein